MTANVFSYEKIVLAEPEPGCVNRAGLRVQDLPLLKSRHCGDQVRARDAKRIALDLRQRLQSFSDTVHATKPTARRPKDRAPAPPISG